MSREAPQWAQVGADMVEVRTAFGRRRSVFGNISKITHRLANGNIKIEGGTSQWRPHNDGRATMAGGDSYSRSSIRLLTDELRSEIEKAKEVDAALRVVQKESERLDAIWRQGDDETILTAARAIGGAASA